MKDIYAVIVVLALAALLIFGVSKWEDKHRKDGKAIAEAEYNRKAAEESERQRKIESAHIAKQEEAEHEHQQEKEVLVAERNRARASADKLRADLAAERDKRPASSDPIVVTERSSRDKVDELLNQCGQAVELLAGAADKARSAGRLCERSYDAIQVNP